MNMKLGKFFLLLFAIALFACSDKDVPGVDDVVSDNTDNPDAMQTIRETLVQSLTGRWQLVRQGEIDRQSSGIYIEFDDNGNVACEYGVGSDNYKKEVYVVKIETDWTAIDKKAIGHIAFPLCGEGRFLCSVEDDQLILLPDEGVYYIMDPTKYFVKVN